MELNDLIARFSSTEQDREKAIFSTLFIAGNKLQTLFDSRIPELSLKQFMLLTLARQSDEPLTLTKLGALLGCSRQNVKKLAEALQKKGFVELRQSPGDTRAVCVRPTQKADEYFRTGFSAYQRELSYLFEVYTPEETETLCMLMSRLYAGIEHMEKRIQNENSSDL